MPPLDLQYQVGDCFELKDPNIGLHLHVIVASHNWQQSFMVVYISTSDIPQKDTTTLFTGGEHSFITKPSWVRYQNIRVYSKEQLDKFITHHYGKIDENILSRIQDGILISNKVSKENKSLYLQWHEDALFSKLH